VLSPVMLLAALVLLSLAVVAGYLAYVVSRYAPIIGRIFEETPVFLPLRVAPEPGGENVRFRASDGIELAGTYYRASTERRAGVIVFCPEYLSDRWSFRAYVGELRDLGYDLFTFDFRNHGESESDPNYRPLQWVTDFEMRDLAAALAYLRARADRDPAGYGLFGISRGGGAALCVAARDPHVWGVITDGAFPTTGTMQAYMHRWAEIYVNRRVIWRRFKPLFNVLVALAGWAGRVRSQRRLRCRFPEVERAAARLAPRPWLMIHGEKDAYIGPEIALELFARAGEPKEFWIVPGSKHNHCRECEPEEYRRRVVAFITKNGPRRPLAAAAEPRPLPEPVFSDDQEIAGPEVEAPLSLPVAAPSRR
jgi:uncharacterized protein